MSWNRWLRTPRTAANPSLYSCSTSGRKPASTHHRSPPTNVSIIWNGRILDTKEKWLAFLAEIEADRACGVTVRGCPIPPQRRLGPGSTGTGTLNPSPEPDLTKVLDHYRVEYLIVGGGAAQVYGAQRPT